VSFRSGPILALLASALLVGCIFPEGGETGGGVAPRIVSSFPASGSVQLPQDGAQLFSVEGEDDDSLDLTWRWLLDDEVQVFGESADGAFDQSWTLDWAEELSGATVDVVFEVSDGDYSADLLWPVDVQ
jgi:hypothetical protein